MVKGTSFLFADADYQDVVNRRPRKSFVEHRSVRDECVLIHYGGYRPLALAR